MHSLTTSVRALIGALLTAVVILAGAIPSTASTGSQINVDSKTVTAAPNSGSDGNPSNARLRRYYAAIYASPNGAYGYAYDYSTSTYANRAAYKRCAAHSGRCQRMVTYYNSCGALAATYWSTGELRRFGAAGGYRDVWAAVRRAKAEAGSGAETRLRLCTTR